MVNTHSRVPPLLIWRIEVLGCGKSEWCKWNISNTLQIVEDSNCASKPFDPPQRSRQNGALEEWLNSFPQDLNPTQWHTCSHQPQGNWSLVSLLPRLVWELGLTYWSLLHSTIHFKMDTRHSRPFFLRVNSWWEQRNVTSTLEQYTVGQKSI